MMSDYNFEELKFVSEWDENNPVSLEFNGSNIPAFVKIPLKILDKIEVIDGYLFIRTNGLNDDE